MGLRKFKIRNGGLKHIYIHNDGNMRMTLCVIFFRNWDKFMRKILPEEMKIKFSGGVRSLEQLKELSGIVDRIGTSVVPQ